jgi:putative transposase
MPHPYPPRCPSFSYLGTYVYSLTFVVDARRPVFVAKHVVDTVLVQILRAGAHKHFATIAYCFMPDHLHIVVQGEKDDSDCRAYIKSAKQYSGYHYSRTLHGRLWQRYGYERVLRNDLEVTRMVRYIVGNPVRADLVIHPLDYPFLGSQRFTVEQLLEWCEYSGSVL